MKRVALLVQYDGSNYSGWQRQKNATAIQEVLERALFEITNQVVKTFAAGRTDAGVHASGQVVHFDIDFVIPGNSYSDVLNSLLPLTIRILEYNLGCIHRNLHPGDQSSSPWPPWPPSSSPRSGCGAPQG